MAGSWYSNKNNPMATQQFTIEHSTGKTFTVCVQDILSAPVDTIVNPANSHLAHGGGLAAIISRSAGPSLDDACNEIIMQQGQVPVGGAVLTVAGNLPFKGIIHAVGPRMGSGDELDKISSAIFSVLQLVDDNLWSSVAFPAISTGIFSVPIEICARAFKQSVPGYWDNHPDSGINKILLCLMPQDFDEFKKHLESGTLD